jgi:[ribosomal protein S18]-alanine N-acetyltransferase
MRYRRATPGDFLAIADLDRRAWTKNRNAEFIPDGEHVWRLWCEHGLTFCALAEDDENGGNCLVGAIVAFPCLDGRYCVHKAFVEEAQRGQRIGAGLFEALLNELDAIGADAFLTVDPVNEAGIRLYERWGFTERQFVPGFYRSNEDRYVLTRRARR